MSKALATQVENNFTRGLITEATVLNFPENACTETFDCEFDDTGVVTRRAGFDFESGYSWNQLDDGVSASADAAITEYEWKAVAGDGTRNFVVVQNGTFLNFYEMSGSGSISASKKTFWYDLATYQIANTSDIGSKTCAFASGNGELHVVHEDSKPFTLIYDPDTDTLTSSPNTLVIRDFVGLDDGEGESNRPNSLSGYHQYNLYNQGWSQRARVSDDNERAQRGEPVQWSWTSEPIWHFEDQTGKYPSNSDVWWLHLNAQGIMTKYSIDTKSAGTGPAPKGAKKLDPFNEDRGYGSPIKTSGTKRPTAIEFFAGRIWYGGVNAADYNTKIWFTQVIKSDDEDERERCYQQNDPTSETLPDLLATDGGVIVIPEIGNIRRLFAFQKMLVVFASNGVWAISGGENGAGFAANDYVIQKLSDFPVIGLFSVVSVGGTPFWWSNDNIFTLKGDNATGAVEAVAVTEQNIKTFLQTIPTESKPYIKGRYNERTNTINWLYRSSAPSTIAERYIYDRVLVFNTSSGAFYPWTIGDNSATYVRGISVVEGQGSTTLDEDVTASGVTVTNSLSEDVTTEVTTSTALSSVFKYLVSKSGTSDNDQNTFAETKDTTTYTDWYTHDSTGVDYVSYGLTGYKVHTEGMRTFQTPYLFIFMSSEVDASLYVSGYWSFANSPSSARITTEQQAYTSRVGFGTSVRRLLIRGGGESLQYKFRSETGKPFTLLGWSIYETANSGL